LGDFKPAFEKKIQNDGGYRLADVPANRGGQSTPESLPISPHQVELDSEPEEANAEDDGSEEKAQDTSDCNDLREYRNQLVGMLSKAEEAIDGSLLSLSGGALGISFAFISDIVSLADAGGKGYLFCSWISWTLCIAITLISMFLSPYALRKTIKQVANNEIYTKHAGGIPDQIIALMNILGIISFIIGIIFIICFVNINI